MKLNKRTLIAGLASGILFACHDASAQLELNMNYVDFTTNAPGSAGAILNGASLTDAIAVMDHAAAIWEDAFKNSTSSLSWATAGKLTRTIDVSWDALSGSTLATGGGSFFPPSGEWAGNGTLTWDSDASSTFFVDTTPTDNAEWNQFSERALDLGGTNPINVERVSYDAPAGITRDNSDMLSVAVHEIGHALGFSDQQPLFQATDLGSDGDVDITAGLFAGSEITYSNGHTTLSIGSPGNDNLGTDKSDFPYEPDSGWFNNSTYNPYLMGPVINTGTRKGITAADIAVTAQFLGFIDSPVNYNPVPEPTSAIALALGGLLIARRRRRG